MRSRERVAQVVMLVLVAGFAVTAIVATVNRSLIPRALDATVTAVEVRSEKHVGVDDVWLIHLDGRPVHVDAATAEQLPQGATVRKQAWERHAVVDGRRLRLALSDDARGMLAVMPLTVVVALVAVYGRRPLRMQNSLPSGSARTTHDTSSP